MKENKEDVRSRFTKGIIKSSLLQLLENRRLKEITVAEICVAAKINRGTFYNHFFDIYDVYERIEDEFFDEISARLNSADMSNLGYSFYKGIMDFISQNLNVANVIVADIGESSLMKRVTEYLKNKYVRDFSVRYPKLSKNSIETLFTYVINGAVAIIVEWLKQDENHSTEQIAADISRFNQILLNGFLNS